VSTTLATRTGAYLERRSSRRGFLVRAAMAATAAIAAPTAFLLRPNSAYASVCGTGSSCAAGWTVFCCSVYRGMNKCPPGTFVGGWWKTDNSPFCCSGGQRRARYIIDCHTRCTNCTTGCSNGFCNEGCHTCRCRCNSDQGGCDNRRHCCNEFRYGQCNQHIGCSGPVVCRVATCTPPYRLYDACGSTTLTDNRTNSHNAPCLSGPCA
jgi:hypothetical protein